MASKRPRLTVRASRQQIETWRARAELEGMSLNEWVVAVLQGYGAAGDSGRIERDSGKETDA